MKKFIYVPIILFLCLISFFTLSCKKKCKHNWSEATCETPKTCQKCNITDGEPLGHDIVSETVEIGLCNIKVQNISKCTRCSYGDIDEYFYEKHIFNVEFTIDKEATIYEEGEKSRHCQNCDARTEITSIPVIDDNKIYTLEEVLGFDKSEIIELSYLFEEDVIYNFDKDKVVSLIDIEYTRLPLGTMVKPSIALGYFKLHTKDNFVSFTWEGTKQVVFQNERGIFYSKTPVELLDNVYSLTLNEALGYDKNEVTKIEYLQNLTPINKLYDAEVSKTINLLDVEYTMKELHFDSDIEEWLLNIDIISNFNIYKNDEVIKGYWLKDKTVYINREDVVYYSKEAIDLFPIGGVNEGNLSFSDDIDCVTYPLKYYKALEILDSLTWQKPNVGTGSVIPPYSISLTTETIQVDRILERGLEDTFYQEVGRKYMLGYRIYLDLGIVVLSPASVSTVIHDLYAVLSEAQLDEIKVILNDYTLEEVLGYDKKEITEIEYTGLSDDWSMHKANLERTIILLDVEYGKIPVTEKLTLPPTLCNFNIDKGDLSYKCYWLESKVVYIVTNRGIFYSKEPIELFGSIVGITYYLAMYETWIQGLDEIKVSEISVETWPLTSFSATLDRPIIVSTTDKEEIARLINEWKHLSIAPKMYIQGSVIYSYSGVGQRVKFILASGEVLEFTSLNKSYTHMGTDYWLSDFPTISPDKITSTTESDILDIRFIEDEFIVLTALEYFYADEKYYYYFNYYISQYIFVYYLNGEVENIKDALNAGRISITDLDRFGIYYNKTLKNPIIDNLSIVDIKMDVEGEYIALSPTIEYFYQDENYKYYFPNLQSHLINVYYDNGDVENLSIALMSGKVTITDLDKFNIKYYKIAR